MKALFLAVLLGSQIFGSVSLKEVRIKKRRLADPDGLAVDRNRVEEER